MQKGAACCRLGCFDYFGDGSAMGWWWDLFPIWEPYFGKYPGSWVVQSLLYCCWVGSWHVLRGWILWWGESEATFFPNDSSAEEEERQRRLCQVGITSFLYSFSFSSTFSCQRTNYYSCFIGILLLFMRFWVLKTNTSAIRAKQLWHWLQIDKTR